MAVSLRPTFRLDGGTTSNARVEIVDTAKSREEQLEAEIERLRGSLELAYQHIRAGHANDWG